MAMIMNGGTRSEYAIYFHRPGGLCYNCHHAGCKSPPSDIIEPHIIPQYKKFGEN